MSEKTPVRAAVLAGLITAFAAGRATTSTQPPPPPVTTVAGDDGCQASPELVEAVARVLTIRTDESTRSRLVSTRLRALGKPAPVACLVAKVVGDKRAPRHMIENARAYVAE